MMDTVLNLGLNDQSVEGLAKQTDDERFAYDSYRRFVAMYGRIVLGLPGEEFDTLLDAAKELAGTTSDAGIPIELLRYLVDAYQQIVERHTGKPFPQDPASSYGGPSRRSSPRGTARGPSPTGCASASPTTWAPR
jgi:pyruvate,orthophosphate dikinase